jgi:hypothetical protein
VNYVNPNTTGSLQFTPAFGVTGTAVVSVVVSDSGGTSNGGSSAITNTFTVTINPATTTWNGGDKFTNLVSNATGAAGVGYSQINVTGYLDIQATGNNPVVLDLASLNGGLPGLAANFNSDSNYTWAIITATRGISGFDPAKFNLDTSMLLNDLAGGTFTLSLAADSSSIALNFTPNHPPVATPFAIGRPFGNTFQISVADLLAQSASDPDGDAVALVSVESTNETSVTISGGLILLNLTNNWDENLRFIVRDVRDYRPGDTIRMATNTISLTVTNVRGSAESIVLNSDGATVSFLGVPGFMYDMERTTDLLSNEWVVLSTTNCPPGGGWIFTDPNPPYPNGFYRARRRH